MSESALPAVGGQAEIELVDVQSGERLPATVDNARQVIESARAFKKKIDEVIRDATEFLIFESRRAGTRTFHAAGGSLSLGGGPATEYDAEALGRLLRAAGCPEERVDEAITAEISYKVNRRVLRSLSAANPDYKKAIDEATVVVEKPIYATLK